MSQVKAPQSSHSGPVVVAPLTRIYGRLRIGVEVENGKAKDVRVETTFRAADESFRPRGAGGTQARLARPERRRS